MRGHEESKERRTASHSAAPARHISVDSVRHDVNIQSKKERRGRQTGLLRTKEDLVLLHIILLHAWSHPSSTTREDANLLLYSESHPPSDAQPARDLPAYGICTSYADIRQRVLHSSYIHTHTYI